MGYHSDVTVAMKIADFEDMLAKAKNKFGEDSEVYEFIKEGKDDAPKCSHKEYTYLQWLRVKWYEDFDEVAFILEYLKEHKNYHLIEIGEDDTDIYEENYTDEFLLSIKREVVCEYEE